MKQAFYYMFKDLEFLKKTYICYIFILISTLVSNYSNLLQPNPITGSNWLYVLLSFLTAIIMFVPQGYMLSLIKSVAMNDNTEFLPDMNLKSNFIQGLKISVAFGLLYFLIITLLSIVLTISIVAGMTTGIKAYFFITIFLILFVLFILYCYFPVFTWMFAFKDNFLTYFRYILATKIFCINFRCYVLYFIVISAILIPCLMLLGFLSNPVYLKNPLLFALITIIDSIIMYYMMLTLSYLIAKSVKTEAFELLGVYQYNKPSEENLEETPTETSDNSFNEVENTENSGYIEENTENNTEENNNESN